MGLFTNVKPTVYRVIEDHIISRNAPFIILYARDKTCVSKIIGAFAKDDILHIHKMENGFGKVSKIRNIWVPMDGLERM